MTKYSCIAWSNKIASRGDTIFSILLHGNDTTSIFDGCKYIFTAIENNKSKTKAKTKTKTKAKAKAKAKLETCIILKILFS